MWSDQESLLPCSGALELQQTCSDHHEPDMEQLVAIVLQIVLSLSIVAGIQISNSNQPPNTCSRLDNDLGI